MKITVYYTDGHADIFSTLPDAQRGIEETVLGCDFATNVENIEVEDGPPLACQWKLQLLPESK